ncbi:MAG: MFS transporter [Treponemataceae bacterium]|nr:MFS transporter [Treponemataceae bacterium]
MEKSEANITEKKKALPLWTRDFTIITIGSAISMFGNSMASFGMSLMVLDYTQSSLLYAIYIALYTFPQLISPIISGAILDRFSRKKMIYTLDFISATIYILMGTVLMLGFFNYALFATIVFLLGIIESTYHVAYDSFYPLLVSEGNFQRAYSVSSVLETVSAFMVPLAALVYNLIGIGPIMLINSLTFLIAAIFETQIKQEEKYIDKHQENITGENASPVIRVITDIKDGFTYLSKERGLMAIALYFLFINMAGGAMNVMCLPYYKSNFENGEYLYMLIFGMYFVGRTIGGMLHYKFKLPVKYKFTIAILVYVLIGFLDGFYMFLPIRLAMIACFFSGISGITSYTIRISSTQNYVPDEMKGRFNGAFLILSTTGSLLSELIAGFLSEIMDARFVVLIFNLVGVLAAIVLIGGNRKKVAAIYNTDN